MILIDEATLTQVARDVCETMLGFSLSHARNPVRDGGRWVATVRLSGDFAAIVEIETVRAVAQRMACRMFAVEPGDLDESDLRDALGEVVNMIGGNVKGILSGEFDLSLPRVEERDEPSSAEVTDAVTARLSCEGSPFRVRLAATQSVVLTT